MAVTANFPKDASSLTETVLPSSTAASPINAHGFLEDVEATEWRRFCSGMLYYFCYFAGH